VVTPIYNINKKMPTIDVNLINMNNLVRFMEYDE